MRYFLQKKNREVTVIWNTRVSLYYWIYYFVFLRENTDIPEIADFSNLFLTRKNEKKKKMPNYIFKVNMLFHRPEIYLAITTRKGQLEALCGSTLMGSKAEISCY